jgi:hypothetical protein
VTAAEESGVASVIRIAGYSNRNLIEIAGNQSMSQVSVDPHIAGDAAVVKQNPCHEIETARFRRLVPHTHAT